MKLFALETSTEFLSLAILRDGALFERNVDAGQRHSDLALPLIRELFAEAQIGIRDLDAIVFGQGPGSFTGVRIACGLAQGMSLGSGVRLLPIVTPLLIAQQAGASRVLVAQDARMDEVYLAAYSRDAQASRGWSTALAPCLVRAADGHGLPRLDGDGWLLVGSALDHADSAAALRVFYRDNLAGERPAMLPRAREALAIAERVLAGKGADALVAAHDALPLYLRNQVALTIDQRAVANAAKASAGTT